jgi:copper(I)-binding protein
LRKSFINDDLLRAGYVMNMIPHKIRASVSVVFFCAALSLGPTFGVMATDQVAGDLKLSAPWIRASVPGQVNGAGYVQIDNKGKQGDRLVSATTSGVNRVELHTIITENGVAKMREVQGIDVPANGSVKLTPGSFHIMFLGLGEPFKAGATVPVTLKFEKAGEVKVSFDIKPATYNPSSMSGHGSHRH